MGALEQAILALSAPPQKRTDLFALNSLVGMSAASLGALASGLPTAFQRYFGVTPLFSLRLLFIEYALVGLLIAIVYRRLSSRIEVAGGPARWTNPMRLPSRRRIFTLAGLFGVDSFGSGLVVESLASYWFFTRFGLEPAELGAVFFSSNVLTAVSLWVAARLARRIGLLNTMVFTHIPSSLFLIAMVYAPAAWLAILFWLLLRSLGYPCAPRAVLLPLGVKWTVNVAGREQECEVLRKSLEHALVTPAWDEGEYREIRRRQQKDLSGDNDLLGGSLNELPLTGPTIELLRPRPVVAAAGALVVPMSMAGLRLPRISAGSTFAYYLENAEITEDDLETGVVNLSPKSLKGMTFVSNELIRASLGTAEMVVRQDLQEGVTVAEDQAFLDGVGGGAVPQGVLRMDRSANDAPEGNKITLHNAKTIGAQGDTFEAEDVTLMTSLIEEGNDRNPPTAWILRPMLFAALANRRADAVTAADGKGPFLFVTSRGDMSAGLPPSLAGVPVYSTTSVPRDMRKGSATTLTAALVGNWRQSVIARVGGVELAVSEHARFSRDQMAFRVVVRSDFALRHPSSIVISPTLRIA